MIKLYTDRHYKCREHVNIGRGMVFYILRTITDRESSHFQESNLRISQRPDRGQRPLFTKHWAIHKTVISKTIREWITCTFFACSCECHILSSVLFGNQMSTKWQSQCLQRIDSFPSIKNTCKMINQYIQRKRSTKVRTVV